MPQTTHLALPLIDAAQAQKHVTHNEALALVDALAHLSVSERNVAAPPASASEGDRLLVGAGASGAFAGKGNQIATFLAGAWTFLAPQAGWRAFVETESLLLVYDGAAWVDFASIIHALQNLTALGVGTVADAGNPLSVKANAALLTAETGAEAGSGDLRVKMNKESAANTVSQLYQTDYSGRAETGLVGDDNFRVKVSPDGATWSDGIVVDKATGAVSFPSGGPTKVLTFATSDVYAPSPGLRYAEVVLFGAGGGGGSGARGASGAARSGGGGGGGAAVSRARFTAAQIGASQIITIGAGGAAGAAQSSDGSAGVNGGQGGATSFGVLLTAGGGGGGAGGGLGIGSGGGAGGSPGASGLSGSGATGGAAWPGGAAGGSAVAGQVSTSFGGSGGAGASATGGAGSNGGGVSQSLGASGGGAGGGVTAANAASAGGLGGYTLRANSSYAALGGAAGAGGNPGLTWALSVGPLDQPGTGGGGGGSHATTPGAGGGGGFPGGGGGGGGASQNGSASGAGGAGASGFAIVIEHF